jgi:hypothetical protein
LVKGSQLLGLVMGWVTGSHQSLLMERAMVMLMPPWLQACHHSPRLRLPGVGCVSQESAAAAAAGHNPVSECIARLRLQTK